jgi:hypothetical protein
VALELGITPVIIRDQELEKQGFGGIYGVGKAAVHPPALAVLSHTPQVVMQTWHFFFFFFDNFFFFFLLGCHPNNSLGW